jgi:hypothetical protein
VNNRLSRWGQPLAAALLLVVVSAALPSNAATVTGVIAGSVESAASATPLEGVCVHAFEAPGGHRFAGAGSYEATTSPSGTYKLSVPVGYYIVWFDPSCGGTRESRYGVQYYFGQLDAGSANPVFASAVTPATGTDANLPYGYSLSGNVSAASKAAPGAALAAAGTCVSALDQSGLATNATRSAEDGAFTVGNLPPGSYSVFFDPTCAGERQSAYATQYYDEAPFFVGSARVEVPPAVTGIDAQLVPAATLSGAVHALGAASNGGICAYALAPGGAVAAQAVSEPSGAYHLGNLPGGVYTLKLDPTCAGAQPSYFASESIRGVRLATGQILAGLHNDLPLRYGPPLAVTTRSLPVGRLGVRYLAEVLFEGPSTELGDYRFTATGLPKGLSLLGDLVVGRPEVAGLFKVVLRVRTVATVPPLAAQHSYLLIVQPRQRPRVNRALNR